MKTKTYQKDSLAIADWKTVLLLVFWVAYIFINLFICKTVYIFCINNPLQGKYKLNSNQFLARTKWGIKIYLIFFYIDRRDAEEIEMYGNIGSSRSVKWGNIY